MTTMLDRVAEAICQADEQNGGPPWGYVQTIGKHAVNGYYDRARAAITAMRDVDSGSSAMLAAGKAALYSCASDPEVEDARSCWEAMIDEAAK